MASSGLGLTATSSVSSSLSAGMESESEEEEEEEEEGDEEAEGRRRYSVEPSGDWKPVLIMLFAEESAAARAAARSSARKAAKRSRSGLLLDLCFFFFCHGEEEVRVRERGPLSFSRLKRREKENIGRHEEREMSPFWNR